MRGESLQFIGRKIVLVQVFQARPQKMGVRVTWVSSELNRTQRVTRLGARQFVGPRECLNLQREDIRLEHSGNSMTTANGEGGKGRWNLGEGEATSRGEERGGMC